MRSTEPGLGCFRSCSWCLWKALDEEGCMGLVSWGLDRLVVQKFLKCEWFLHWKFKWIPRNKVLEGKISWERDNTWRLTIQFKHDFLLYLAVQKIDTYIAKQCSHVEFPYFVMGSHLGQQHRTTFISYVIMGFKLKWPMNLRGTWNVVQLLLWG
jgi:hypothetical protein